MQHLIRSFIAFDITEQLIIEKIRGIQNELVNLGADLKLVEPANLHITLRFLGEIAPSVVENIKKKMVGVKFKPFKIELKGLGAFPNLNNIRVIWVGIEKGSAELAKIAEELNEGLRGLPIKKEDKPFSPHLTIARTRSSRMRDKLSKYIKGMSEYKVGELMLKSLKLKRSVLTSKGPVYSTLFEVELR